MAGQVLAVAEHLGGMLKPVSLETCGFSMELAAAVGQKAGAVVLGSPALPLARELADRTGIDVIAADHPLLSDYNAEAWISALTAVLKEIEPSHIIIPHTATGWDYAPRLAVALEGSCHTGVTGFTVDDPPRFIRQICNGKITTEVRPAANGPAVVTVMPGAAKPPEPAGPGDVEEASVDIGPVRTRNLGVSMAEREGLDLTRADVIVAVGRGIRDPDGLGVIRELASCFDRGAVGASRPVVDAGWLAYEHQVGQTGQTVSPRLYIACGISGAIQHTIGMSSSELIVAINTDPGALIFRTAHLGVVHDLQEFLPVLIEKIRQGKKCPA